jgi:hypothetical protein
MGKRSAWNDSELESIVDFSICNVEPSGPEKLEELTNLMTLQSKWHFCTAMVC